VDTSNEIAGDGDLPHPCIGHARRLMVTTLREQANVMVECVQNHTPSIMVIDEIGRKAEVLAAQTSKHRGVRMIASAHGDFRSLLKNRDLVGLLGGLETLTLGDKEAEAEAARKGFKEKNKQKTQRAGAPIFEIIIELRRGMHNEWVITTNSAAAVDDILDGEKYHVQRRIRDAETGTFYITNDKL
jgi:stage III sporulation protein SpoIIIAA